MNPPPMDQAPPLQGMGMGISTDAYLEAAVAASTPSIIANATPSYGSAPVHPPYAEMIMSAITALKETDGSSKKAIAKYIERAYPNLPAAHPALLTHHLKRLKNCGQLSMVKKSYILPGPTAAATTTPPPPPTTTRSEPADLADPPTSLKRRPGRPPKAKAPSSFEPTQGPAPAPAPSDVSAVSATPKRRGRPPKQPKPDPAAAFHYQHQNQMLPVYAAAPEPLGSNTTTNNPAFLDSPGLANGTASSSAKRRGRPPKYTPGDPLPAPVPAAASAASASVSVKRRAGRPPKASGSGRPRGRPRKSHVLAAPPLRQVPPPPPAAAGTPRGRPRKRPLLAVDVPANVPAVGIKRRGRPPSKFARLPMSTKLRVGRTGRPVGRPRKNPSAGALHVSGQSEVAASVELTRKLEYMQLKVKNAVGLLKPHLINANIIDILTAIQDLEELATMDITAPSTTAIAAAPVTESTAPTMAHETAPSTDIAAPLLDLSAPAYPDFGAAGQLPMNFN